MRVITIGRSSENEITLNDGSVSRHHCQIVQNDNGTFSIVDFGSTNGTFVNGQRISGQQPLNPNDVVKVGNTLLPWRNYFGSSAPIPTPPTPHPVHPQSTTKTLPIVLGILGGVAVVVILLMVFLVVPNSKGDDTTPQYTETTIANNEPPQQNISTTIDEPQQENKLNETDITGKWEWLSDESYLVDLNDGGTGYSRTTLILEMKDDGTTVSGNFYGGFLLDVIGDGGIGGTFNGKWDGEKYVVNWRGEAPWASNGKAIIRVLSPQKVEWKTTAQKNDMMPNVKLKKVKRFEIDNY